MTQQQSNRHKVRLFILAIAVANGWAEEAGRLAADICRICRSEGEATA